MLWAWLIKLCVSADNTIVVLDLEPVVDAGPTSTSLGLPPPKRPKVQTTTQELVELERERCLLDIENAKLFNEVLQLKKQVLEMQKERLERNRALDNPLEELLNDMI